MARRKSKRRHRTLATLYNSVVSDAECTAKKLLADIAKQEAKIRELEGTIRLLRRHTDFVEERLRRLSADEGIAARLRQLRLFRLPTTEVTK